MDTNEYKLCLVYSFSPPLSTTHLHSPFWGTKKTGQPLTIKGVYRTPLDEVREELLYHFYPISIELVLSRSIHLWVGIALYLGRSKSSPMLLAIPLNSSR